MLTPSVVFAYWMRGSIAPPMLHPRSWGGEVEGEVPPDRETAPPGKEGGPSTLKAYQRFRRSAPHGYLHIGRSNRLRWAWAILNASPVRPWCRYSGRSRVPLIDSFEHPQFLTSLRSHSIIVATWVPLPSD